MAMAARMPMMMMTTRSSMRVKPPSRSSAALRSRASMMFLRTVGADDTVNVGRPEERLGTPTSERGTLLLDVVVDAEDRHVEADDHRPDDATEDGDHDGLDQRGQRLGGRLDFLVIEVGDLLEHLVESTCVLTHGHHLRDHRGKDRVRPKGRGDRLTLADAFLDVAGRAGQDDVAGGVSNHVE